MVIADEAHRIQYDFVDGFARHMREALPHASFIDFTGTPIELQDANTRPTLVARHIVEYFERRFKTMDREAMSSARSAESAPPCIASWPSLDPRGAASMMPAARLRS